MAVFGICCLQGQFQILSYPPVFRRNVSLFPSYLHLSLPVPESLKEKKKTLTVVEHVDNLSNVEPVHPASSRTAWAIKWDRTFIQYISKSLTSFYKQLSSLYPTASLTLPISGMALFSVGNVENKSQLHNASHLSTTKFLSWKLTLVVLITSLIVFLFDSECCEPMGPVLIPTWEITLQHKKGGEELLAVKARGRALSTARLWALCDGCTWDFTQSIKLLPWKTLNYSFQIHRSKDRYCVIGGVTLEEQKSRYTQQHWRHRCLASVSSNILEEEDLGKLLKMEKQDTELKCAQFGSRGTTAPEDSLVRI